MKRALRALLAAGCAVLFAGVGGVLQACEDGGRSEAPGDPRQWRGVVLAGALRSAELIGDPYRRSRALAAIAQAQVLMDAERDADATLRLALAAAEEIPEAGFRGWALHDIVEAHLAANDVIGARETVERIASRRPQGAALALIAGMQLRGEKLDDARHTAMGIRDRGARDHVLWQVAALHLLHDDRTAAWETAGPIRDALYRARAYGDIAVHDMLAGDLAGVDAAIARVRKSYRGPVYGRIAVASVQLGDMEGAREMLSRITDPFQRAEALGLTIAARHESIGVRVDDGELAAAVLEVESAPDRQHRKPEALVRLARAQAETGDSSGARSTSQLALKAARELPTAAQRDDIHDRIARVQAGIGEVEAAFATASLVEEEVLRALLVRDLVAALAGSVRFDEGRQSALRELPFEDDPLLAAAAQFGLIGVQLNRADRPAARRTISLARETVAAIEVGYRSAALAALAGALAALGDVQDGWDTLQDSLCAAASISRPDRRAAAHVRVANALNDRLLFLGKPAE